MPCKSEWPAYIQHAVTLAASEVVLIWAFVLTSWSTRNKACCSVSVYQCTCVCVDVGAVSCGKCHSAVSVRSQHVHVCCYLLISFSWFRFLQAACWKLQPECLTLLEIVEICWNYFSSWKSSGNLPNLLEIFWLSSCVQFGSFQEYVVLYSTVTVTVSDGWMTLWQASDVARHHMLLHLS